ncbi:hypothetical protein H112_07587 [Trichophyton rubrum D6]|uniref:Uncharacterized protein n=4 Tax=Trichophyton TaxID=5550 RepID=A0A178EUB5_TRIRU|nr:uncharacterized protein TERG_00188 [Trichophyton rubrum CBS 118892]EZF11299.1 hypothetical protein H100_07614 [Trichophyton rubrum MR850]EZF38226.1 hypothetical protein H102_07578 [Trichophyton rubrum CBS 100081]EZF48778.1 hypothetical protein H103_07600 [Trichophyton rubrum CBS 288.86]EZF59367.1 hypothetical protein H104_07549 [Trichophyton rubrum CBS 289.86]EZF70081.1 hypothetical protein H105_07604 [Trichophyton soudanense CBS 452.61]EZF80700.1 hypothetical protein H110_07597 [Trichophy
MARFRNSLPKEVRTLYTFGVEVEFIINFKIADFITAINTGSFHHPAEWKLLRAVYEHIINEMQSNGFLVNPYLQNHNNASYWTIKQATSIVTEEFDMAKDEWGGCPVRLVAPVMTYGSPSFDLINNVLIFLDQQFDIVVNASCSLNVHVGNIAADKDEAAGGKDLESLGFSLTTVENLLSFIWLFQLQLQEIHPPSRVCESVCLSPFILLSHLHIRAVKEAIQSCTSMQQLCRLWDGAVAFHDNNPGKLAYSIKDMAIHASLDGGLLDSGNRTVQFGQHQSTMDMSEIYHWVMLVGHLVRLADTCRPWCRPLGLTVERERTRPFKTSEYATTSLLIEIGAVEHADFYSTRLHQHDNTGYIYYCG